MLTDARPPLLTTTVLISYLVNPKTGLTNSRSQRQVLIGQASHTDLVALRNSGDGVSRLHGVHLAHGAVVVVKVAALLLVPGRHTDAERVAYVSVGLQSDRDGRQSKPPVEVNSIQAVVAAAPPALQVVCAAALPIHRCSPARQTNVLAGLGQLGASHQVVCSR